jgi:hypothetical protein
MIPKRSQSQKQQGSFRKTKVEGRSRVLSGLRVQDYSCSEATFMSSKTEIWGIELWSNITIHAGCFKTLEIVSQNYQWPQMSWYIGLYVKMCDLCNRTKLQHWWPSRELHPPETPEEQWDIISVNFIIELPDSHGYNVIMNVNHSVSKRVHCIHTHTMISTEGVSLLFFEKSGSTMDSLGQSFHIKALSSSLSSCANSIAYWELNLQHLWLITHRPMARLNVLTKSLKDTFKSSPASARTIGMICFL